jgi:hypothetical protein
LRVGVVGAVVQAAVGRDRSWRPGMVMATARNLALGSGMGAPRPVLRIIAVVAAPSNGVPRVMVARTSSASGSARASNHHYG